MFSRAYRAYRWGASRSRRATTTDARPRQTSRLKKLGYGALGMAVVAGVVWIGDLWVNDDFDIISDRFRRRVSPEERKDRPHLVILGSGWGALNLLRKLHTDEYNVTVVSPRNYFLFTPLLPGTTTGTVEYRSIIEPIRRYCNRSDAEEARFIEMECVKIDPKTNTIHCVDNSEIKGKVSEIDIKYDQLVVAVGAETATFGIPGVRENTQYMKSVEDTMKIRNRIMDCLETAAIPGQPADEVDRLLHFVVVGGGPAGVEFAAELHDFLQRDVKPAFRELAPKVKITLVEALPHILNMFDAKIINYVESKLSKTSGMQVLLNSAVVGVEPTIVKIKSKEGEVSNVPYGTLVWATGNAPRKLVSDLIMELGPQNQPIRRALSVDDKLRVIGSDNIWAIGDSSVMKANYPATAQVASQQGRFLGRLFNKVSGPMYKDKKENTHTVDTFLKNAEPFIYQHFGSFAYIGDREAVADFRNTAGGTTSTGLGTFVVWRSVYMSKLLSFRNRVLVSFDWLKAYIFGRDVSRG